MKPIAKISLVLTFLFAVFTAFTPNEKFLIVIDAGHGGHDAGAKYNDIKEKDLVREIARQIVDANHDPNTELFIIGEEDKFMDLDARVRAINALNPSVLVSLHVNSSTDATRRGAAAYVSPKNKFFNKSKAIANDILLALEASPDKIVEKDLRVLQDVQCPAVTLEVAYLSNDEDRRQMASAEGQKKLGEAIYRSVRGR